MLNLVLYQPDIPQNLGACLRLSACLGATVHIIEPCGFLFDDQKIRRAGMDYIDRARYIRHLNWDAFLTYRTEVDSGLRSAPREPQSGGGQRSVGGKEPPSKSRLFLLETDGATPYTDTKFLSTDYIVLGQESAGTPRALYPQMDAILTIPMRDGSRSLNVAMSAGMLVAEACRQLNWKF